MADRTARPVDIDLLEPTIDAVQSPQLDKPWRIQSQFWVAFLGGVVAVTAIAWVNAARLRVPSNKRGLILAVGAAGCAVVLWLWMRVPPAESLSDFLAAGRGLRLYSRIVAVVVYLVLAQIQRPHDALHAVFAKGEYGSLWKPGIAAVLIGGILQAVLTIGAVWMLR